jgi:hypothetical protein
MDNFKKNRWLKGLIGYYGVLQLAHLFFLGRAATILLRTGRVPFPASPPPGGWPAEVVPFLMGMAGADVIAAALGIYFSLSLFVKKRVSPLAGIISLTIALASAVVYLIGTLPSGAWINNPISYLIVLVVFSPIIPLFVGLVRQTSGLKGENLP